jgi:hypothetical protein
MTFFWRSVRLWDARENGMPLGGDMMVEEVVEWSNEPVANQATELHRIYVVRTVEVRFLHEILNSAEFVCAVTLRAGGDSIGIRNANTFAIEYVIGYRRPHLQSFFFS